VTTTAPDPWDLGTWRPATYDVRSGLVVRPGDVPQLSAWAAVATPVGVRARTVLLAGSGMRSAQIAEVLGTSRQTVSLWCGRYVREGLGGLSDRARPTTRGVDDAAIVAATVAPPPRDLRVTHWSARTLADHLGVGRSTVSRAWQSHGVRPHGLGTFRLDTSPELVAHVADVAAVVVARDLRLVAVATLPAGAGRGSRHHDPVRAETRAEARSVPTGHGPLRAYAALQAATETPAGRVRPATDAVRRVLDRRLPWHRQDRRHELVIVGDRPDVAELPEVRPWCEANPRAVVRHVDGPERWLRLVDVLLRLAEAAPLARGASGCAPELSARLRALVEGELVLPGAFAWADPAWRVAPTRPPVRTARPVPRPR
jgi:hypothetical protein